MWIEVGIKEINRDIGIGVGISVNVGIPTGVRDKA